MKNKLNWKILMFLSIFGISIYYSEYGNKKKRLIKTKHLNIYNTEKGELFILTDQENNSYRILGWKYQIDLKTFLHPNQELEIETRGIEVQQFNIYPIITRLCLKED